MLPVASTSLLLVGSCGDDEKDNPVADRADLLLGEWEVLTVDGEEVGEDNEDYTYSVTLEFQADGDFQFCYQYVYHNDPDSNYSECYDGDWEWSRVGEKVDIQYGETYEDDEGNEVTITMDIEFTIKEISESQMEGTWETHYEDESYSYEIVLKKL